MHEPLESSHMTPKTMSKRAIVEETSESSTSKRLKRVEPRSEDESVTSDGGLTQLMPSNFVDDGSGTVDYYQTTILPQLAASHSFINYAQRDQTNIYNHTHIHNESSDSDRRDKIHQWLSPTIPSTNYDEALEMRLQKTGRWIIEDERFSEWKENADSLLWLYGKPGSGKTVLSSSIIEDISLRCHGSSAVAFGYFFFDGRDSQKVLQRLEHLIISLIWQFSERCDTLPKALNDLYDVCGSGSRRPSLESLHKTLLLILDNFHHAYLILDALDECTERNKLLKWIDEIARWKAGKLHLLTTSRQEPDIQKALRLLDPILICLEGEFVERDIMSYLDWMLRDGQKRKGWDDDTCCKIKTSLVEDAQGMFRWVALQFDELRRCRSRHQVEKQLGRLPKDLNESYDRIIFRIDERDREDAMKLFQWLAFSIHPLALNELAEVVTVDFESRDLPWFDRYRRYDDVEGILEVCSGFVSITEGKVKLAHFSVKTYLLSQAAPSFRLTETNSHLHISETCLAYLAQFDGPHSLNNNRLQDYPLARYAAMYWVSHTTSGDFENALHQKLAINIFHHRHMFVNWIQIWDLDRPWIDANTIKSPDDIPPPLYYASRSGLGVVVRALLKTDADVNAQGGEYGNALQAASSEGHELTVKILLENNADVNAQGGRHGNALQAASLSGHEAITRVLLENGADVNAQGGEYGNALLAASLNDHEAIAKILLEIGADVDAQGGHYGNALQAASLYGHEALVKILLENGADVSFQGEQFGHVFLDGAEALVKILLGNGAEITQGGYGNALQAASSEGHKAIVEILLNNGADVNAQGGRYGNALQAASLNGREAIVKILLENGADANAEGGWYGNALQASSLNGHEPIVSILLEAGVDVNAQGGVYGNALRAASSNGREAIVKTLLENGAYASAQGGEHDDGDVLQTLSLYGRKGIVKKVFELVQEGGLFNDNAL